jgi:hypothetical protein
LERQSLRALWNLQVGVPFENLPLIYKGIEREELQQQVE